MSVETHRVLMGACGWKHQAWLDDFYTEDLPEEWQLGFYSNEFPVVYVPAAEWIDLDVEEWTEDISDSFRFILEVSSDVLNDEHRFATALKKANSLGEFCLGLILQVNQNLQDDIQLFQKRLDKAQEIAPVCIDKCGTELTKEFKNTLINQNISEVWNGEPREGESLNRGSLAVSRISGDNLAMADLRKVIEGCLVVSNDERTSVLCIDGKPPSLELLRNADIILNLL
ncbi:MAG: hypothetical protein KAT06_05020 [Gammaproteobacteria bacterium]|nr:hypothetical protein [Gammaproteobacteria bacterium]